MILYHGTSIENAKSIIENGFFLTKNEESRCNRIVDDACVYGFDSIEQAKDFAFDQCYENQAVICFTAEEEESDPEYESCAFYTRKEPVKYEIIYTHDNGEEWEINEN